MPDKKKPYIIQRRVLANSVTEALSMEQATPVTAVYIDSTPDNSPTTDGIGFKYVPVNLIHEV